MKITQWIIFAISGMLVLMNLRMIGAPLQVGETDIWSMLETMHNGDSDSRNLLALDE